jgi:hypothetical protein
MITEIMTTTISNMRNISFKWVRIRALILFILIEEYLAFAKTYQIYFQTMPGTSQITYQKRKEIDHLRL